jgi:uncharacterized membrane protein YadS
LAVATTVKLARALWIIPVALMIGWVVARKAPESGSAQRPKRPWFILGFLAAAALVTWIPALSELGQLFASLAKRTLVLTLFLIGSGLTRATIASVGPRPFVQGIALWAIVGSGTLAAIRAGWIQ